MTWDREDSLDGAQLSSDHPCALPEDRVSADTPGIGQLRELLSGRPGSTPYAFERGIVQDLGYRLTAEQVSSPLVRVEDRAPG